MRKMVVFCLMMVLVVLFSGPGAADAVPFGSNIIINGNAEVGSASGNGYTVVAVPGWTTSGNFTVVNYNTSGGFPTYTDPGPANRGSNFFAGGSNNGSSSATQIIDLSGSASIIDTGNVGYDLSGYFGGFASQDDNAILTTIFLNGGSSSISSAVLGPVYAGDRGSLTGRSGP